MNLQNNNSISIVAGVIYTAHANQSICGEQSCGTHSLRIASEMSQMHNVSRECKSHPLKDFQGAVSYSEISRLFINSVEIYSNFNIEFLWVL